MCPARTASSHRQTGRVAGNDAHAGGRSQTYPPVAQRQNHGTACLGPEAGGCRDREGFWLDPAALRGPKRHIKPLGAFEVEFLWKAIGWQGRRQGRAVSRSGDWSATTSWPIGRAPLPSWRRIGVEPGEALTSTNASTRPPGAKTMAPLRAEKGSAGSPSRAMTRTSYPSILRAITVRWQPLMKRNRRRSRARALNVKT